MLYSIEIQNVVAMVTKISIVFAGMPSTYCHGY